MRARLLCWVAIAAFAVAVCGCPRQAAPGGREQPVAPGRASGGTIAIKGSDTMLQLGQRWAEAFMKKHPDVTISVTGGGSGTGIAALLNGTCDIAQASRPISEEEKKAAEAAGLKLSEFEVARDAVAVIVHRDNPINELSLEQISRIYRGEINNWKQLGGRDAKIVRLARETSSGTHVFFKEHVVRLGGKLPDAEYAADCLLLPSNQAIHDEVMNNPDAIGYIGLGYLDDKVKAVAIKGDGGSVKPSVEAASSGEYPLSRPLFWYTGKADDPQIRALVDFVRGDEGQKIVAEVGFVPIAGGGQ